MAFDGLEPIGGRRDDWNHALTRTVFANIFRNKKKKGSPYEPSDFIADWDAKGKGTQKATSIPEQKRFMHRFSHWWNRRMERRRELLARRRAKAEEMKRGD